MNISVIAQSYHPISVTSVRRSPGVTQVANRRRGDEEGAVEVLASAVGEERSAVAEKTIMRA